MTKNKRQVEQFLKQHHLFYRDIDMNACCEDFLDEMRKGLSGCSGTLKMIPTYISLDREVDYRKNVIVMDAGGTNFRVALVRFDEGKQPVLDYFQKYSMPGAHAAITKEEFFSQVAAYLDPVIDKSDRIAFCFSYPTEILPDRDGRLIRFNKEIKVSGMEGEKIGENLIQALKKAGHDAEKSVILINDTVATLLGGLSKVSDRKFGSYLGFILGTGTNTCYIEQDANVTKNPSVAALLGNVIINIESGGYGRMPRSDLDAAFDSGTESPGTQLFEKMVSGAYQGGLLLTVLRQAAREGVFTPDTAAGIKKLDGLESFQLDRFCEFPYGENPLARLAKEENDREKIYELIDALFERAGRILAVNLASVILKTGAGKNPCKPVCISADGSTLYQSKLLRSKLDYYLVDFLNKKLGIWCELVQPENATIVGTAIAGLLG